MHSSEFSTQVRVYLQAKISSLIGKSLTLAYCFDFAQTRINCNNAYFADSLVGYLKLEICIIFLFIYLFEVVYLEKYGGSSKT